MKELVSSIVGEIRKTLVESVWGGGFKNDLPDSSFAYIEPGGKKDSSGKTVPRKLRHFPYKNADGSLNRAHVIAAEQMLSKTKLGPGPVAIIRRKIEAAKKALKIGQDNGKAG